MRRPTTAGATPSASAAAVKLPLAATAANDSICFKRSMPADYRQISGPSTGRSGLYYIDICHESTSNLLLNAGWHS
jgi:hypothetical protein